jgi:NAD(P)-dependent dehydrogenase (short-subunit alcohol dehydrogenase family)
MRLENHVALVTGGSRGIGRAIVQRLAEEGASVTFTGRNPETGLELEKILRHAGLTVRFVAADSAREADVRHAVESTIETFGGLNTVCHNAAATDKTGPGRGDSHVADIDEDTIDALFAVAVKGAFWAAKYGVRHMRKHGGGALINISAASSTLAMQGRPAYQASKGALNALTRQMAVDYGPDNIRSNAIIVGFIDTGSEVIKRLAEGNGRFISRVRELIVLPRLGAPADIANGVLYLASDEGSYVTGVLLPVDGGYTCHLNVGDSASIQTYQP